MRILINEQSKESTYLDPRKKAQRRYYEEEEEEEISTPAPQPLPQQNFSSRSKPRTERDNQFYEKLQINDSDDERTKRIKEKALRNLQKIPKRNLASSIVLLVFVLIFSIGCIALIRMNILTNLSIGIISGSILLFSIGELLMFILDFRLPSDLRRIPTKIISMVGAATGISYFILIMLMLFKVLPPTFLPF